MHFDESVVLEQLQHELRVNETSEVEDEISNRDVQSFNLLCKRALYVALEDLGEVAWLQLFNSFHFHLVEVMRIVFTKIADQVLINDFVANGRGLKLG